jgi:hypothetical protein
MSELRTNKIFPKEGKPSGAMGGGIVQVVRAQNSTANQTPSSTTTWTDVNPTCTITPTSSSNLIIIETSVTCITRGHNYFGFRLLRGSTVIREWWGYSSNSSDYTPLQGPGKHIDSPGTTSAVTYHYEIYAASNSGYFMWNYQGPDSTNPMRQAEIYCMELSA